MDKFVLRKPRDGDDVSKTVSNKPKKKQTTIEALSVSTFSVHYLATFLIEEFCGILLKLPRILFC